MYERNENLSRNKNSFFPGTRTSVFLSWRGRARSSLRIARSGGNNLKSHFYWLDNFLSWARLRTVLPASRTGPRSWRWSLRSWRRPGSSTIQLRVLPTRWFAKISSKVNDNNPSGEVFPLRVSGLELQAQAPVSLGSARQVNLTNI